MSVANRVLWIFIGLLLTAAGVVGVLISLGHLPGTDRNTTIMTNAMSTRWREWGGWATAVLIVAGLIVAALGAMLLRAELRRRGGRTLPGLVFTPETLQANGASPAESTAAEAPAPGTTRVSASTLRHALQHDLQNDPRIKRASVRITGRTGKPQIHLHLDVASGSDVPTVHESVTEALDRFRTTSHLQPSLRETVINIA